ncbi:MAG: DegT/DnrJ/EryC1/StrS family aminotransferase [Armatimonadetes bacterium]|nr:DegT/DnrJ/EryC1/StrS family aminotransferase [Armatimonadota bacterium]
MSTLAIDGGTPVRTKPWPAWPQVSEAEWDTLVGPRLKQVYLSATEGLPNPMSAELEAAFCAFTGAKFSLFTSHGTDALMTLCAGALDIDGVGPAGELICPEYTFIASASAPLALGCSIVFADIDKRHFCLDPAAVEAAISPRTVAIMNVQLGGQAGDMDALQKIADKHGLALLEDCAQAHGARHNATQVGAVGTGGGFSFQSSKNLTSGEGGMVTTNDEDVYNRASAYRNIGRFPGGKRWEHPRLGQNYRGSEYLAALLLARLTTLDEQTDRRDRNGVYLNELLAQVGGITPPERMPWCGRHAYHIYMLHYHPDEFGGHSRDEFIRAMNAEGVPATLGYNLLLSEQQGIQSVRERYPERVRVEPSPQTQWVFEHTVWLFQSVLLAERADMDDIAEAAGKKGACRTARIETAT